jgi:hypothetical protein
MSNRAKYWERMLSAWEKSGLSQAEFCRRRDVKAVTFAWWKRQLRGNTKKGRRQGGARNPHRRADFVEVTLPKTMPDVGSGAMPMLGGRSSGYEITLSRGRVIRLPRDFDPTVVAQLVAAVESC